MGKDYYKMQLDEGVKGNYSKFLEELGIRESAADGGYQAVSKNNYLGKYQIGEIALCDSGYYSNSKRKQYMKTFRNGKRYSADRWDGKFVTLKNLSIKSFDEFLGLKASCPKDLEGVMVNPYLGNSGNIDPKVIGDANALKLCQTLQEDAIRCVHINTWKYIYVEITKNVKTAKYKISNDKSEILQFLKNVFKIGTTLTYKNQSFEITTSGIIAGGHLCGWTKMRDFLLNNIEGRDGNGTSILEYMQKFEGYNMSDLFTYVPVNERTSITPVSNGNTQSTVVTTTQTQTSKRTAQKDVKESASGEIIIKDFNPSDYGMKIPPFITESGEALSIDDKGKPETSAISGLSPKGNIVCNGASLKCTEGDASSTLSIIPAKQVFINNQPIALISETKPMVNIKSFGQCKIQSNPAVVAATSANSGRPTKAPCVPNTVGIWSDGLSYLSVGEAVVSDKSTCKCAYAGIISIEKGKEGQSFLGYKKAGGSSKEDKKEEEKKKEETKKIPEAKKVVAVVDTSVTSTVKKVEEIKDGLYLLEKSGDSKEKIVQRHLKAIGFNLNHKNCKECDAYGAKAEANKYKCTKGYKCVDGDIGVKSASALIIFQSKCNPPNSGAQKTGEPNIITGLADATTIESLTKNREIKSDNSGEKRGVVNLSRDNLIKDWKPEKYETISNEILPKELTVLLPELALASPSLAVAWSRVIQGALDAKGLVVNNLNFSGPISGFRSYPSQVKTYFEFDMDATYAAKPYFDFPNKVADEYKLYKKNPTTYDFIGKTKNGCILSGKGKSNHGKCRAIDLVAGKKKKYILEDSDCPNELKWLNDNMGKYGFTGYVSILETSSNPLKDYSSKKGFYHIEVWHWDYLESYSIYTTSKGINYNALDCFIKENREKLMK